jgi:hypothetical protein
MTAKTVVDVILGEAKAGSYQDMLAIASVISNRATGGRTSWQDVVARTPEFNAYGNPLPRGVNKYRSMAQKAINQVKTTGPIHNATFYATPNKLKNLPKGLSRVTETDGHVFLTDPQKRPIYTGSGLKRIDYAKINDSIPTTVSDDSLMNLEYNNAGLPDANAPIPAGLFGAAPKSNGLGLSALNPSGTIGGELSYVRRDQKIDPNYPISAAISGAGKELGKDIQVTSGYRSPSYNRSVGGAKNSLHVQKKAMDISMAGMSNKQRQELVQNLTQRGAGGFITYDSMPDILHVDMRNRKSEFRPHFMHNKSKDFMHRAPEWFKEMDRNDGVLLPKEKIPVYQPQTSAAGDSINPLNNRPILNNGDGTYSTEETITVTHPSMNGGKPTNVPSIWGGQRYDNEDEIVDRAINSGQTFQSFESIPAAVSAAKERSNRLAQGLKSRPTPVDFSTNLYPSGKPKASDYSNYQMMKKHSALPLGMAAPKPVARPTDIPKPTYTPKASDYSNYMMNVKQPTLPTGSAIPTPAARPADLGPMAVIDGPVGKPIQNVPIPAPTLKRESRFDKAKRTFGNNLKEQLKPETIAARGAGALIGGLLGGPMGAKAGQMFGPNIAQALNSRRGGIFGGFNQNNQAPMQTGARMGSSSSEWGSSQNKGATYSASDGAFITGLGNGTYSRTNPITGKSSQWNADGSRSTKGY